MSSNVTEIVLAICKKEKRPRLSYLVEQTGVSRQRVHQILKQYKITNYFGYKRNFSISVSCTHCGKLYRSPMSAVKNSTRHFCNRSCWYMYKHAHKHPLLTLTCCGCRTMFSRTATQHRNKNPFCSRLCYLTHIRNYFAQMQKEQT